VLREHDDAATCRPPYSQGLVAATSRQDYALRVGANAQAAIDDAAREIAVCTEHPQWLADYFDSHRTRLALDYQWCCAHIDHHAQILEVGAYPFFVTRALARSGYPVRTVDHPGAGAGDLARVLALASTPCDIEREPLPFPDDSFDEVLFNEVFEHLRIDLPFTLRELRRVLRPGARLWLSTPNVRSIRGLYNFLVKQEVWSRAGGSVFAQWDHLREHGWMGHVREYTAPEVVTFLRDVGFTVDRIVYRGDWTRPVANLLSMCVASLRPYFTCIARKAP
jgi:SAM-dependent methyltransferase